MADFDDETYVREMSALLGIALDDDRIAAVARQFAISRGLAAEIMDLPLTPADEPAPRFEP